MNKQKIKKIVPKLRFPEFRNTEEWEEMPLGKLGQTISGLSGKSGSDFGSGKPFVTYMQVYSCAWIDFTKCGRVLIADNEKQNTLQRGDILFTTSSETPDEVGFASVILDSPLEPLYLNSFCFAFRPDNLDVLRPEYSRYLFHSPIYRKSITVLAQGITRYNISKGAFLNLRLPIPEDEKEQQKIADCLSSIDDFISLQSKKLDALKAHKKGLMQQLFPTEGETIPKLRFPEFRNAGEWEKLPIGEKVNLLSGYPFKSSEISEDSSGVPLMRGINITEGFIRHNKDIDRFFFGNTKTIEKYKLCTNDLVIGMDGSKVGKNSALITEEDSGSLLIQRVARLRTKLEATIRFVFQHINSIKFHSYVDRINTSGGIPHISANQINEFEICFPNIKEQQKIADCLSSIDELITAQGKKLNALKAHKKGLMQQLFPTKNESGK